MSPSVIYICLILFCERFKQRSVTIEEEEEEEKKKEEEEEEGFFAVFL